MNYTALESFMKKKKISRRKLAELADVSPNTLTSAIKYKTQKGKINQPATIRKFADILDTDLFSLLTDEERASFVKGWHDDGYGENLDNDTQERIVSNMDRTPIKHNIPDLSGIHSINIDNPKIWEIIVNLLNRLNDDGIEEINKRSKELARLDEYKKDTTTGR